MKGETEITTIKGFRVWDEESDIKNSFYEMGRED